MNILFRRLPPCVGRGDYNNNNGTSSLFDCEISWTTINRVILVVFAISVQIRLSFLVVATRQSLPQRTRPLVVVVHFR